MYLEKIHKKLTVISGKKTVMGRGGGAGEDD